MTAKNRITLSAITAVVIVICLLLAYRGSDRPLQTSTQAPNKTADNAQVIAPPPASNSDSVPKNNAAKSIRAAVIASNQNATRTISGMNTQETAHTKRAATTASDMGSTAPSVKTPQQLVARFTEDDPTQVFQPETVRYHSAVQAEPIDDDWGPQAQAALRDFFSSQLAQLNPYVVADCRTDLCELQIVSDGTDSKLFYKAIEAFKQQGAWTALQFDQDSGAISYEGGRTILIYFFSRM
jgi:hypothetical protein